MLKKSYHRLFLTGVYRSLSRTGLKLPYLLRLLVIFCAKDYRTCYSCWFSVLKNRCIPNWKIYNSQTYSSERLASLDIIAAKLRHPLKALENYDTVVSRSLREGLNWAPIMRMWASPTADIYFFSSLAVLILAYEKYWNPREPDTVAVTSLVLVYLFL